MPCSGCGADAHSSHRYDPSPARYRFSKLTRGAAVAGAAGVFLIFAVTMFFHGLAWFLNDLLNQEDNVWVGFGGGLERKTWLLRHEGALLI